mmetsp:Transcript_44341/g.72168  ORF Transcript_44341/g.72168 Transcript_44341/m.72168 type:complete len:138 (+) Transcript_44341:1317-1730(+)
MGQERRSVPPCESAEAPVRSVKRGEGESEGPIEEINVDIVGATCDSVTVWRGWEHHPREQWRLKEQLDPAQSKLYQVDHLFLDADASGGYWSILDMVQLQLWQVWHDFERAPLLDGHRGVGFYRPIQETSTRRGAFV